MKASRKSIWSKELLVPALVDALKRLSPWAQIKNPVMFVVWIAAAFLSMRLFFGFGAFEFQIALWLWITLFFANLAESISESRSKAQTDFLRKARTDLKACRVREDGRREHVSAADLKKGDTVVCAAGDTIPSDGEIIEGIATVDESVITGESAPVIRESGGDKSSVTGGTTVLSDSIKIRITADKGATFLDKMIGLVKNAKRQRTPNEIALGILLVSLTLIFAFVVFSLPLFLKFPDFSGVTIGAGALCALLVCLIPTTIGGLLGAIGISGMDRLMKQNVIAMSGKAVEAAGDIDVLLLDKTGTITTGNRQAVEFFPAPGVETGEMALMAELSSLAGVFDIFAKFRRPLGNTAVKGRHSPRFDLPDL